MSGDLPTAAELQALGPDRSAALWLERLQRDAGEGDGARFQQWLDAGEANRQAWARASALWNDLDEAGFADLRNEALAFRSRSIPARWIGYAAAASIAVAVLAASLLHPFNQTAPGDQVASATGPGLERLAPRHYATPVGQRATVKLDDGSTVTLDTDSAVEVAYADGQRLARLTRGQAFFDIAHDQAHPFRVAAGGRVVSVLGTRFNIRLSGPETRVVLVEGAVGVSRGEDPARPAGGEIARLAPGQQLVVRPGRADAVSPVDVERWTAWRGGFLRFDDDPLSTAVAEMNRYTDHKLVIGDPKLADLRISGAFRAGDLDGFAETVSALYPVRVVGVAGGDREIVGR